KGLLTQQLVDGQWIRVASDPLAHIAALLAPHAAEPLVELPPFQGGAAGYVGYDWGMMLERVPRARYDDLLVPDVQLALYDWVIAWDHPAGRAWIISTGIPERGAAGGGGGRKATWFRCRQAGGMAGGGGGGGVATAGLPAYPPPLTTCPTSP